ncbi:antibiotic biosynthesis monooxygenase [Bacillus sp. S/N-304-OC-R1]|uniref:antibiotic biosynthesis monooxygenase family protein n=1 Tax=Bacillus sp. S/N-304-OC-R1 TaxID=2758034 RepID=UPI001C8EF5AF|nr:antibiotic biosynthesis monooxygenase [Bacillus sp. S/N-304-OC-R1]MBY0121115.1 antibiotic biosynthesis monooxygenase [Bacillus sp. S/N-304-OC-R1]
MNIYMTSGTYDFLKRIKEKHSKETMLLMQNNEGAVLIHETLRKTVFSAPRSYDILKSEGLLENSGFLVLNHIPVMDDDKPVFEYRFKNDQSLINKQPGLLALRVLRPIKSNTYVILTLWKNEKLYLDWENTPSYQSLLQGAKSSSAQPQIFTGASYTSKYYIPSED